MNTNVVIMETQEKSNITRFNSDYIHSIIIFPKYKKHSKG